MPKFPPIHFIAAVKADAVAEPANREICQLSFVEENGDVHYIGLSREVLTQLARRIDEVLSADGPRAQQ